MLGVELEVIISFILSLNKLIISFSYIFYILLLSMCESAVFNPVSDAHRSATLELLSPSDGSFGSMEVTYEALTTLEVLGVEKKPDVRASACASVAETIRSTSSASEDLFNALRVNGILKCEPSDEAFALIESRFNDNLNDAKSLLDFYYSIGSLVLVKDQTSNSDVHLRDADKIFRSLKVISGFAAYHHSV